DGVLRLEPRRIEPDLDLRVQALEALRRAPGLVDADACRVVHHLALEIIEARAVAVDDADAAEASGADYQHLRLFQALLSFAADLLQHQLALVALDLVRGEHDQNVRHPSRK